MSKPPKIIKLERHILAIISQGHPDRIMTIQTSYGNKQINPLTWSEIQVASNQPLDTAGNCIAHLVNWQFIESAKTYPGFIRRLLGQEGTTYFWITALGQKFLDEHPDDIIPEKIEFSPKESMTTDDFEEAVRAYEDSCSSSPYTSEDKIKWATSVLDVDIKEEIKASAIELENMWQQFENLFGHRGPAKNQKERSVRDPVVKKTTIKIYRALDEQLKRKGFPPSSKPPAWHDYYENGDIGLPPPPWEK
ncbi:MAG: hypothetical protein KIT56_00860 [Gammaproteobacteria bacterium]|nr:hypothetical protein [Gammaproteobacteria bacterium]MCW5582435.1 hypothetical protein [Gammaproteobacteria bacterium]